MLLNGKRIFYVEDDVKNKTIVQLLLEQAGAKFAFERWGGQDVILRLLAFAPVDLILLDLMLPRNVSGYDVFDIIRDEPSLASVPIAAISASDPSIEMPKARDKGFVGFISKPVDLRLFSQQIAQLLCGQPVWYAR